MTAWTRTRCSPRRNRIRLRLSEGRLCRTWDRRRADGGSPDSYSRPQAHRPVRSPRRSSGSGEHGDRSLDASSSDTLGSVMAVGDLCGNVGTQALLLRSDAACWTPSATPPQTLMAARGLSPGMRRFVRGSSQRRRGAAPPQTETLPRQAGAARAPAADRPRLWKGTPSGRR